MALTPNDLQLPSRFQEFRPCQIQALEAISKTNKKVVLLQAPTGTGKTLIMAAWGKLRSRVLYTCHTKQLQDQVVGDFPYGIELKGRANYPCLKNKKAFEARDHNKEPLLSSRECSKLSRNCRACHYDCNERQEEGVSTTDGKCPCLEWCPFELQKAMARRAKLAILNVPLFLAEANYAGDFSEWPWVILDEGDLTEKALMGFIELSITQRMIEELELMPPAKKTVPEAWLEWAKDIALPRILAQLSGLGDEIEELRQRARLERLRSKFEFFIQQPLDLWAFITKERSWTFKPVFISHYCQQYLWRHGQRFLVMSATIISPEQFAHDLGLDLNDVAFIDLPSTFSPERRPVIFWPAANMTHKTKDSAWPKAVEALDSILDRHPEKGLIHSVSYSLAHYVVEHSRHRSRLIWHDFASDRVSQLSNFRNSTEPLVLISPSMERGVDLPDDLCRFIVVLKIPYPDLSDKQVSARLYSAQDGQTWYSIQAIRSLVQATGRGMRHQDDFCVSYILDQQFERLYTNYYGLFPYWWREALRGGT